MSMLLRLHYHLLAAFRTITWLAAFTVQHAWHLHDELFTVESNHYDHRCLPLLLR